MNARIISLCPSNTEMVCALGLADCLIAVDLYSDYPPRVVERLPRVGPDLHIDVDRVIQMKPDLVLASLSVPGMERVVDQVHSAGLPTLVLHPRRFEEIFNDLRRIAEAVTALGHPVDANPVIDRLRHRIHRIANRTRAVTTQPALYWEWWPKPIFSPAADNWLTELSELAGARNVFSDVPGDQVQDDGRRVLEHNPDYILAVWTGVPQHKVPLSKLLRREGWSDLTAVQSGRVYVLSEGLYCRPSPRLVDGLEQLVSLLHPDLAADLALPPSWTHAPVRRMDGEWLGGYGPLGTRQ